VGEDPVLAPDRGSGPAIEAGTVPAVTSLEVADPPLRSGAPLDQPVEDSAVLDRLASS